MTAPALALRTAESVPGVTRLMEIEEQLQALREERLRIASVVVADVEFMDVPTIQTRRMPDGVTVGMVFHVNAFESEQTGRTHMYVHAANSCAASRRTDDCAAPIGARIKRRYTRVGRRYWNTFLGAHVLVGEPQADDDLYTLALLSGVRS